MTALPSAGALDAVRRLAGPAAAIANVAPLAGGQHAATWRVDTANPATRVVVRQFPSADPAAGAEQRVLSALDGLGGLAPRLLDGDADVTPRDPRAWARELGGALARVHAAPPERVAGLPARGGATAWLAGPLAGAVRARWAQIGASPAVLTHGDYWSGNVVWRDGRVAGVVDWTGGAPGPRGYDLGWCRLDLVLLSGEPLADAFTDAYAQAAGAACEDLWLWDAWAAARAHEIVGTWGPNYAPLGRADLDERELLRRHARWTARLLERA